MTGSSFAKNGEVIVPKKGFYIFLNKKIDTIGNNFALYY